MDRDERLRAADALEAVLREADQGELQVTAAQQAYLRGAIDTLRAIAAPS